MAWALFEGLEHVSGFPSPRLLSLFDVVYATAVLPICVQRAPQALHTPCTHILKNMNEGDTLVRRRSRRSTAGNR